jgi:hypothetical protein
VRRGDIYADIELTIAFHDNCEERFVYAYACAGCGQVRLMIDLDTKVEP